MRQRKIIGAVGRQVRQGILFSQMLSLVRVPVRHKRVCRFGNTAYFDKSNY